MSMPLIDFSRSLLGILFVMRTLHVFRGRALAAPAQINSVGLIALIGISLIGFSTIESFGLRAAATSPRRARGVGVELDRTPETHCPQGSRAVVRRQMDLEFAPRRLAFGRTHAGAGGRKRPPAGVAPPDLRNRGGRASPPSDFVARGAARIRTDLARHLRRTRATGDFASALARGVRIST